MLRLALFVLLLIFLSCDDDIEYSDETLTSTTFKGRTDEYSETKNVYFGDLHVHTGWSFDAYLSSVRVTPDDAYRFAKGEYISHPGGDSMQMQRPLDFMAVSDHAEYMGGLMQMNQKDHNLYDWNLAKQARSEDISKVKKAARRLRMSISLNWPFDELIQKENLQKTWADMVAIADRHYKPGEFTTFPAFEWTSSVGVKMSLISGPPYAQNLHRNVIFKGGKVSALPFSSFDSQNPEKLWEWMEAQRNTGVELLAIPHNANISDGRMYAFNTFEGKSLSSDYIKTRLRNEPVSEVVQIKGQSMAHPILSPNDEFADFSVYQYALGIGDNRKEVPAQGAFVRQAFKDGLSIEKEYGQNPFQFGIIGSSDSHNGGPNVEENNNIGRSGTKDLTPEQRLRNDKGGMITRKTSVAGLAAVWATENTREAIYEALERKEVYATSGPRIRVRFFASSHWDSLNVNDTNWDSLAYSKGVPMGSEMSGLKDSPSFLISAVKDPDGANLDRIQVIKGWLDESGKSQEKIFNVAWSDGRDMDENGKIPAVGNTVDIRSASYTNDIGAVSLMTKWTDPEFSPNSYAFYYIRVLEIPTPRWTTFDAVRNGLELPDDVPSSHQERAWSSPIWYKP